MIGLGGCLWTGHMLRRLILDLFISHLLSMPCIRYLRPQSVLHKTLSNCHYSPYQAIIYVIDSADTSRLPTSRSELLTMLSEDELKNVPVLVFANKQASLRGATSMPAGMTSAELISS